MSKLPGQVAFEAYVENAGGKTHDGKPIPQWDGLTDHVRGSWCAAAHAVSQPTVGDLITHLRACASLGRSREFSLALTKLDEFEMWLHRAAQGLGA